MFMKNFLSLNCLITLLVIGLISGCAVNSDYLEATTLPPITPTDEQDKNRLGELYPVPQIQDITAPKTFELPTPPTVAIQADGNVATIQKMGSSQWVSYTKPPAEAWTQMNTFFQLRQIPIVNSDLATVTMLTNWFTKAVQPGYKIRYLVRVDEGLQPDTSDIYLYNQKLKLDDTPVSNQLPLTLVDPAHASLLSDELVKSLNKYSERIGGSYLATTINLPKKIQLTENDDENVLISIASEDRLNRALSKALSENNFISYGRNITHQVYYFNLLENGQNANASWWKKMLSSSPPTSIPLPLDDILARLPDEPEVNDLFPKLERLSKSANSELTGYLLVVQPQDQQQLLYLRDTNGRKLPLDLSKKVFNVIRESLQ